MTNAFQNFNMNLCLALALLALNGCGLESPSDIMDKNAVTAGQQCDQMKSIKVFKKWSEVSDCYDKTVLPIYTKTNYPNPDLIELLYAKYRVIHEQMDEKKISSSEGDLQKKQAIVYVNNIFSQRAAVDAEEEAASAASYNAIMQNYNANRPRTCSGYGNSVTCY